jgi:hypothetical protein
VELFSGAGWITWAVLAVATVVLFLFVLLLWWIIRLVRRRVKRG